MTVTSRRHRRLAAFGRLVLSLAALVFVFQLLAATRHHHDPAVKSPHCASCMLHAQPHAAPPASALAPAPSARTLLYVLAALPAASPDPLPCAYLRPPSRAPPPVLHRA